MMNDEQFEDAMKAFDDFFVTNMTAGLRARDTAQREAQARVEAEHADDVKRYRQLLNEAGRDRYAAQKQLAEAIKLLGGSKYQLMLWEDYQVENGFEVEDHYVTGKVREEVEAFLARHAQAEQQEALGAQAVDERAAFEAWFTEKAKTLPLLRGESVLRYHDGQGQYVSDWALFGSMAWEARAALATQPAEWIDPCPLTGVGKYYDQGFAEGVAEAKRLNAVRGAEHE